MFLFVKMHQLQPKHSKIKQSEVKELLQKWNISLSQLPSIKSTDKALPKDTKIGEVIKIERKNENSDKANYYRVVVA